MDIQRAFKYVFEDKQWVSKVLVGVLLSLFVWLIIPAFILNGYLVAVVRRVMDGENVDEPLPPWEDWGKLLSDGFFVTIAQLIYTLPFLLVLGIGFMGTIGFGGLSEASENIASAGMMATWGVTGCLTLLFAVALLFLTPAITIQYAIKDDFGACFRFGEIWQIISENLSDILIVFGVTLVASLVLTLVTGILGVVPCLGWIAALILSLAFGPYLIMVTGHLYGQIAAKILGNKSGGDLPTAKIVS
ncbi:MAG: DUF4013 domain-containing protein [Chloroflexota bacterium]